MLVKVEKRMISKLFWWFQKLSSLLATLVESGNVSTDITIQASFEKLVPNIISDIKQTYNRGGRLLKKTMQLKTGNDYIVEQAVKYVLNKKNEMLGESKVSITKTTKQHITNIVTKWLNEGKSYNDIANDIRDQVKEWIFSKARSQLIAVREVWQAYEQWRKKTLQDHLLITGERAEKIWDTVGDSRVTRECRENESEWRILMNELFPSGDDVAPRNANPNCRCTTNFRII